MLFYCEMFDTKICKLFDKKKQKNVDILDLYQFLRAISNKLNDIFS